MGWGGGGARTLVVRPLKKHLFLFCLVSLIFEHLFDSCFYLGQRRAPEEGAQGQVGARHSEGNQVPPGDHQDRLDQEEKYYH